MRTLVLPAGPALVAGRDILPSIAPGGQRIGASGV